MEVGQGIYSFSLVYNSDTDYLYHLVILDQVCYLEGSVLDGQALYNCGVSPLSRDTIEA